MSFATKMKFLSLGLMVCSSGALAAESRWGLKWRAPPECIGPADLARLTEQVLGRQVFGAAPDILVDGTLEQPAPSQWKARLVLVGADGSVMGSREFGSTDADCRSLDQKLALAIAVSIDPAREPPQRAVRTRIDAPMRDAEPTPPPANSTFVHLETSNPNVRLYRVLGVSSGYGITTQGSVTVTTTHLGEECRSPCDQVVPRAEQQFIIGGDNVPSTAAFALADHASHGRVNVEVHAGNSGAMVAGAIVGGGGGLLGILSGIVVLGMPPPLGSTRSAADGPTDEAIAGGVTLIGVGVVAAVVGTVVAVANRTTISFPKR